MVQKTNRVAFGTALKPVWLESSLPGVRAMVGRPRCIQQGHITGRRPTFQAPNSENICGATPVRAHEPTGRIQHQKLRSAPSLGNKIKAA